MTKSKEMAQLSDYNDPVFMTRESVLDSRQGMEFFCATEGSDQP
jgi:hypothetical protein